MDKTGGCSPLIVSFNNTTTGASSNAGYEWDFGNGNTSVLKNAGAVYYAVNTYTVTLKVKDGTQTSIKSKTVTVFAKPSVDFTVTPATNCLPFNATFNSTSIAADGPVTSYYWDFGDGTTQRVNSPQTNHTYTFQQSPSITLTATSSNGCTNAIAKTGILNILPALQSNFAAEKNIYCQVTDEVRFTNTSIGPGTLTYLWDFGDGTTSTDKTPSHTYSQKGTYTVTLTVNSSEGCSAVNTISLNIANFTNNFEPEPIVCINTNVTLNNTSTPAPDFSTWVVDGTDTYNSYGSAAITPYITTAGLHTIQLTNNFGTCQETITKQIDVKPSLNLQGFIADVTGLCGSPVKVNFKDTTAGAVKWFWKIQSTYDTYTTSELPSPTNIYGTDGLYNVSLTVTNAAGCSSPISQTVYVSKPLVGIFTTDSNGYGGCEGISKSFTVRSTEEIKNFSWNFGDGTTSTDKEPQHTFNQPGTFTVKLSYTTINGCTGTVLYDNPITVQRKIVADFTGPTTVCGNTPVTFNSTSTGDINTIIWDYGDNTPGYGFFNTHKFQAEGDYTITFIALNYGCADTIVKTNYIHVSPPFPKITSSLNTCDGDRGTVTFTDGSRQTDNWKWDFGDGTIINYTSSPGTIQHTYTKTGTYKAVLTNTNAVSGCTVKDSVFVPVLLKQHPVLKADRSLLCSSSDIVNIEIDNLERNPFTAGYANDYNYGPWLYGDGSSFFGYVSGDINNLPFKGVLTNIDPTKEGFQAVTSTSYFGCYDTTNIIPLKLKGPIPGFKILTDNACFKTPALFEDTSKVKFNVPIVKWQWNFGAGIIETKTQGGTVSHLYKDPGNYYVTLSVTDAEGCSSASAFYASTINISGPKAVFNPSGTNVPLNTTVSFYNNTNSYNSNNTEYKWDFGDGSGSTDFSPNHIYTVPGTYKAQLIATNAATQCSDTVSQLITVKNFNYAFSISATFIGNGGHCAPAIANFTNTSTNYTRLIWDFGDGFTLENQSYPSHIYKD
ncbi:MAG: PKD domain-containing protein, partial [Bacteroidota bacterium]